MDRPINPTEPFVRITMVEAEPPPLGQSGAIRWARDNLFSSWLNSALTVLGIAAVFWILQAVVPWFRHGVWYASSLPECREIVAQTWGEGASGACWAMIRERWHQFMFGFYPPGSYWRPVLTLALLFVALAPMLFPQVSRRLLWFSLVYPFAGFWMIWGGSLWGPVSVMAGLALVAGATALSMQRTGTLLSSVLAVVMFAFVFMDPLGWVLNLFDGIGSLLWGGGAAEDQAGVVSALREIFPLFPHIGAALNALIACGPEAALPCYLEPVDSDQIGGFTLAFIIGIVGIAGSLPIGIVLALGRQSDMFIVKTLSVGFIEGLRGVPLITLLFTAHLLLNYFLPPGTTFDLILRVVIMVTLFASAYMAEVVRGGLAALPRGQYEAADALGMDYWKAQRLIIMPQALKVSIPGIVGNFIGLFKDTTLVAFVGLHDPLQGVTKFVRADMNWKGIYWEPYIFVGAIFFLFCFGMSRYSMHLEQRLKRTH